MGNDFIDARLADIQAEHDVVILFAVESGSRAWGFASRDSDYDVRFIYVRKPKEYLRFQPFLQPRDVIEEMFDDADCTPYDMSGWDIRKALGLFAKGNPVLMEWFKSPIIYRPHASREPSILVRRLRDLQPTYFSPIGSSHHYLHMATGNFGQYIERPTVRAFDAGTNAQVITKKYLYVLNPLLAALWIDDHGTVPPLTLEERVYAQEGLLVKEGVHATIKQLIAHKKAGDEMGVGPSNHILNIFIRKHLDRLYVSTEQMRAQKEEYDPKVLDEVFFATLAEQFTMDTGNYDGRF